MVKLRRAWQVAWGSGEPKSVEQIRAELWNLDVQSVTYDGNLLLNNTTIRTAGFLGLNATAEQGVVRVEFYARGTIGGDVLLGNDATPGDGFRVFWNAASISDELTRRIVERYRNPAGERPAGAIPETKVGDCLIDDVPS